MARSGPLNPGELQKSLERIQGLAAAPDLLLQIKSQMDEATGMSAELADEYRRTQKKVEVLEAMVKIALTMAGYSEDMIQELQEELENKS